VASFLEGQLANAIYNGFKGKLLKGTLTRMVGGTGTDEFGDPVGATSQLFPFEGMTDTFSAMFRAQAGIPETDIKVLIIAKSITTEPKNDDKLSITNAQSGTKNLQVRKIVEIDPARATYTLQCYEVT
jgi:hypothetical protein